MVKMYQNMLMMTKLLTILLLDLNIFSCTFVNISYMACQTSMRLYKVNNEMFFSFVLIHSFVARHPVLVPHAIRDSFTARWSTQTDFMPLQASYMNKLTEKYWLK